MTGYALDKMPPSQAVALARKIEPRLRREGHRRMRSGKPLVAERHSTRDLIAARTGWSWGALKMARLVVEASERDPVRFSAIVRQMDETRNIYRAWVMTLRVDAMDLLSARTDDGRD